MFKHIILSLSLMLSYTLLSAATFTSANTGSWKNSSTWNEAGTPAPGDDIYINAGHTISLSSNNAYTHTGNIIIYVGGELISDVGNSQEGFVFNGGAFHVFGKLTLPFPDKDLLITGNSLFWGHPSAEILVSDDWKVSGNSETVVEGICVEVDDDFHIESKGATICGGGGISIGNHTGKNTLNLMNGAKANQICKNTVVYRGIGGNCTTTIKSGTGNQEPNAEDDEITTFQDVATAVDVLDQGKRDTDPAGDDLTITAVGEGQLPTGTTQEGGTVSINDNGTPGDPSDDFVDYTPPAGFVGTDFFQYVITDGKGAYDYATVEVTVMAPLPVELVRFAARSAACEVTLEWATASELNSDYFEIQRSANGLDFTSLGEASAAGFSERYRVYQFTDALPSTHNYYRLKQVDFDGTIDYSEIVYIKADCIRAEKNLGLVSLFPNPAIYDEVNLRFDAAVAEELPLSLSDLYGKNIQQGMTQIEEGMNNIRLNIADLPSGTYVVTIGQRSEKFIKVND